MIGGATFFTIEKKRKEIDKIYYKYNMLCLNNKTGNFDKQSIVHMEIDILKQETTVV